MSQVLIWTITTALSTNQPNSGTNLDNYHSPVNNLIEFPTLVGT